MSFSKRTWLKLSVLQNYCCHCCFHHCCVVSFLLTTCALNLCTFPYVSGRLKMQLFLFSTVLNSFRWKRPRLLLFSIICNVSSQLRVSSLWLKHSRVIPSASSSYSLWATPMVSTSPRNSTLKRVEQVDAVASEQKFYQRFHTDRTLPKTVIYQPVRGLEVLLQLPLPGSFSEKLHFLELLHLPVFMWMFQGLVLVLSIKPSVLHFFQCKWQACWRDKLNQYLSTAATISVWLTT